jgi:uncharacterized protein
MIILAGTIELDLPGVTSLKEKRGTIKTLMSRVRKTFNVAIAEVELNDVWQSAALGFAIVSTSSTHAEAVLENVLGWIERNRPDVEIVGHTQEIIHINTG